MGTSYSLPKKTGPSPFTRSGEPPVKLTQVSEKPGHRTHELMSLQLHMADERQRMAGLSPAEREWRAKWLKDQHLHPDEPVHVDAVHRQLNPVRVLYRKPWDVLYRRFLNPTFGPFYGLAIRAFVPKLLMGLILVQALYYQTKYNARNWQRYTGFTVFTERDIRSADQIEKDHPGLLAKGLDQNDKFDYFDPTYFNRDSLLNIGEPVRKY